jgi:hypothetical protein
MPKPPELPPDCRAAIRMRGRIASPKNVTQRATVASSIMLLLPHPAGNVPKSSFPLKELAVVVVDPVELWATH